MTKDIFEQGENNQENPIEPEKNYLEELVGEGKKFKSVEDLARGKAESDNYIQTLERNLDGIKTELDKRLTAEELANQIRSEMKSTQNESNQENNLGEENKEVERQNNSFSEDDISKLVEKRLTEQKARDVAERNVAEVTKTLNDKVGVSASKYLSDKADELGVTLDYLREQAAISPKAFYNLVGLNESRQTNVFTPPVSQGNTQAGPDPAVRNKAYYDKLYKENPRLRIDSNTQIQEHRDALRLGEAFFNN